MKRFVAFILSLLFVGLQFTALSRTIEPNRSPKVCSCCDCKRTDCCVSERTSSAPQPVDLPAPDHAATDLLLSAPKSLTWSLPAAPAFSSQSSTLLSSSLAVPLFTRHCALLI